MIEYIKGKIDELTPAMVTIDCNGVGYGIQISLNTYDALQGAREGKVYIYEAIREDAYILYGFSTKEERELFLLLITVSGIGGNTARMILSAFSPNELVQVISNENANMLKSVKGIGLKTAQRVIVDLKDKIAVLPGKAEEITLNNTKGNDFGNSQVQAEAISALTTLGFQPSASQKVVNALLKEQPSLTIEQIIKEALKRI